MHMKLCNKTERCNLFCITYILCPL